MYPATDTDNFDSPQDCFHCGERIPAGINQLVTIAGIERPMCCPGCSAVAELIAQSGLDSFYGQRTAYNERPSEQDPIALEQYRVYDDPEVAATFTTRGKDDTVNASLLLGGISCAACTWLIENSMSRMPGVQRAIVNMQQSRLDIQFNPTLSPLSEIFAQVESLGYRPRPFQSSTARQQATEEYSADLRRLAVAGLGMMQVGMFAIALHAGDLQGMDPRYQALLRWVSLPVASFVVLYSARPFFTAAWRHLKRRTLVMDLPVALAIGLAFSASFWATISGSGQVYFDSVVMFTFLLLLGRFLESRVRLRQQFDWLDAESGLPGAVVTRRQGQWTTVPRIQVRAGETILINAGDTIPLDGRIDQGCSAVKEDTFNGEHLPRAVSIGDTVFAGTLNIEASLQLEVVGDHRDSRLAALQHSVESAQTEKPRLAKMADRIASWFIAAVLLSAAVTAAIWLQIDPDKAFWISLSVLVISCPCALALATPAALTCTANALRSQGVIVRGENAIESLSRASHLIFDKTGTLTEGALSVDQVHALGPLENSEILNIAAGLQHYSSHPAARAFSSITSTSQFDEVAYRMGAGVEASHDKTTYRIGSLQFCRERAPDFPSPPSAPLYWIGLCQDTTPLAWIGLQDEVRTEADSVVRHATEMGLQVELLTGDSSNLGPLLAKSLHIEKAQISQSPDQKMAYVKQLQQHSAVVTMVGDGLNDAPVLSIADASFAVAGATDLARNQADFVIVDGDLQKVIHTLHMSHRCRRIIRQNFSWALGYNLCALPLAAIGFVPPWAAAIGMSLSSLLVVTNSLRLNR